MSSSVLGYVTKPSMTGWTCAVFATFYFSYKLDCAADSPAAPQASRPISASRSPFQFNPKVFDGVEVSALRRLVKFLHTKLIQLCLYGPCFVYWGTAMHAGIETGFPQTAPTKWGTQELSKMSWYAEALRFIQVCLIIVVGQAHLD
ncbi:hypothetical protein R3I94_001490 [Phoxinus phoxinus]